MKKQLFYFVIFLAGLSIPHVLYAQQAFVATGGNASGKGGSVGYSVGQVAFISAWGLTTPLYK